MQQKQTTSQPDHKNGHKPERTVHPEQVSELVGLAEIPGGVLDANNLFVQGSRLGDPRLQTVQRQRMASQIGHVQGNHHLQRIIQTAQIGKSHAHGSKGNGNVAEATEEGESEGLGAGGILIFNGAGLPPNGNGKNNSSELHHIQRDEEDDRPSEEERARALAKARVAEQAAKETKSESQQETAKSKKAGAAEAEAGKAAKTKKEQAATAVKSLKGKKKQAAESADEEDGAATAKGKGSGMETAEAAQPVVAPPPGPQDKAPASPEEDPAFQAVVGRVEGTAKKQQAHAPAKAKASQAQAASVPPANETTSKAQSNQVGAMEQAQTPAFDAAAFKAQLMERITAMSPKTMKEADEFKDQNKMGSVKEEMQSKVSQEKAASQGPLEEKTKATPDESGIPPKPVTDLQPAQAGAAPGKIGAEAAAPKPKTSTEVEQPFQESSQSIDQEMAQENVTEEQLAKSNEPEFQGALSSKQEAQTHAAQAPQEYRAYEGEQVDQAKTDAAGTAQAQLEGMHGDRAQALTQVMGQQTGAKTQDEAARAKVAGDIQQIYDKTKTNVETILTQLDMDVTTTFDAGAQAATQAFEEYVDSRMEAYKEDRYGGWFGWARWLKDKVRGMPSEVNVFYADGRNRFLQGMDAVINNVVQIIGRGLAEAKAEVANGRKEIQAYVAQLPADLKKVGKQAASDIQDKFDELESSIDAKQNALIEQLASKYNEKLQAVDSRIEELKAANQGLIDKAINAVVGVIKVIKKLKDMITNILSRIADLVMGIITDPIGFLGNMINGIKLGLSNFISNLPKHLINALLSWLTGALGPAGIKLPKDILSLEGIFSLVMQILGLTWDAIRAKAVKLLGEPVVKALETGFEIFQVLITEGPIGLWKYVKEMFGNIKEMVIGAITDMLKNEVIEAGIKWIMGLLTPAGAFIKAAMAIYDIVKFFIEKASQIGDLINAIIDSIAAIAKGGISAAGKLIEDALAKTLPIVIGFLASLLSLGDVSKKVQGIIEKIRGKIDKAVDWVIMKAKAVAGKVMGKLGIGKEEAEAGPETPESTRVKTEALEEAHGRLRGLERADEIPTILKDVEKHYRSQGLNSLTLEQNGTSGIEVVARASDPKRLTITWDEVLTNSGTSDYVEAQHAFASSKEPGQEGKKNAPTVAAMVTVDGRAMGPPLWNVPSGPHAEDRAIAEQWPLAMAQVRAAVAEQRKTRVVFAISATPCGRCSINLHKLRQDAETELGTNGRKYAEFILAPRSLFEGTYMPHEDEETAKTATSARNLRELSQVGWDIRQFAARKETPQNRRWDEPLAEYAHYLSEKVHAK
jgi:hypothetical protein